MAGAAFEAGGISKFFGRLKPKNKPESGIQDDIKKLTPEERKHYKQTGELPTHVQEKNAAASRVDDGTPVHPGDNKTDPEKLDPAQKEIKDAASHGKAPIKEDTVSFSSRNSSTSNLSGKTAVEQPVGRVLQAKQSMEKLYKRTTEKLSFKKKEAPKSEYQKAKEANANWADDNLSGIQRTHYNQLSRTEQDAWRSSGRPPENLEKYYKQMTHTNFPDRELLQPHTKTMTEKYGQDAGRTQFIDEKHMAANYHLSSDAVNGFVKKAGNEKVPAPTMANQPWRNSLQKDDFYNPPAFTGKEAPQPVTDSRRDSSSTLGGNSIKETSPNDLLGERRWSQGSTTTVGSRPASINESEASSISSGTKPSKIEKWKTKLGINKKETPPEQPAMTKQEAHDAWLARNGFTRKDFQYTGNTNKFGADDDGTNRIGWADEKKSFRDLNLGDTNQVPPNVEAF